MNLQDFQKKKLLETPGVYFFLDRHKKPLYIGKATSLKDRVRSYFTKDIAETRSPLISKMVEEAFSIDTKETASVLEALLLEADLIKKFKPRYNTKEKDDKSFNCVVITDEMFPQVLVIRKKDLEANLQTSNLKLKTVFGPYTSGSQLQEALKIIRKIFPYRDTKCHVPNLTRNTKHSSLKLKPCFNFSIGLCPGTCIGAISQKDYANRIKNISKFLSGDVNGVVKNLETEMKRYASKKEFEKAKEIRDKIFALKHINDISLIKSDFLTPNSQSLTPGFRIEAYDIAHMMGQNMVGVMTVIEDGEIKKSDYRKFDIKTCDNANDPKALLEILERRFNHSEWSMPACIVVDGSTAQVNVANRVLLERGLKIPVVAVVKNEKHKPKGLLGREDIIKKYKKEIILANAESHRFAINFHKKKRGTRFLK